ncbi:RNA polymerase sigma factor [Candidatus Clostridium radicumherbarum]|uniref:RNA polymerase sigma factor n=1 Tax=Candidatus Clostridium radicumherbarum TaxID=3381662 RepID=A0ABW8TQG5_9CLOT
MNAIEFEEIILKIADGDKNALKLIYEEFNYVVYNFALSILHNEQDASDVSQEVFIKIWNNACKFLPGRNYKAWIIEITKNQSIDCLRRKKNKIVTEELDKLSDVCLIENEAFDEQVINKIRLNQLLSSLTDMEREIIIMHVIGEITYMEISHILKISFGKVVWNYKKGIKILENQVNKLKL